MPRSGWLKPESDRRLSDLVSVGLLTRVFPAVLVDEVIAGVGLDLMNPMADRSMAAHVKRKNGRRLVVALFGAFLLTAMASAPAFGKVELKTAGDKCKKVDDTAAALDGHALKCMKVGDKKQWTATAAMVPEKDMPGGKPYPGPSTRPASISKRKTKRGRSGSPFVSLAGRCGSPRASSPARSSASK